MQGYISILEFLYYNLRGEYIGQVVFIHIRLIIITQDVTNIINFFGVLQDLASMFAHFFQRILTYFVIEDTFYHMYIFWPVIDIQEFDPPIGHAHTLRLYPDGRRSILSQEKFLQEKWRPVYNKEEITNKKEEYYRGFFEKMNLLSLDEFILRINKRQRRDSQIRNLPGFNNNTYPIILTE